MHVTSPVIMIQQFMLYDLSWTFYFTIYDSRLLLDFLISCLLTCTGITFYMYLCSRYRFLCIFFDSDLLIYMYLLDFGFTIVPLIFIYVTGHCMYLYVWIISLDHVHVWLPKHANWLYLTYSLGCFLTTLNPHIQILESESWWPYCSWSECATEAWTSSCLSGSSFFQPPLFG